MQPNMFKSELKRIRKRNWIILAFLVVAVLIPWAYQGVYQGRIASIELIMLILGLRLVILSNSYQSCPLCGLFFPCEACNHKYNEIDEQWRQCDQ